MGGTISRAAWLAGTMALVATAAPRTARADSVVDAKDLFVRGRELRGHGDCAGAVPLFRKAYELYPSGLGSLRNVAECEESLGKFASARQAWFDLKQALLTTHDPKYDGWPGDIELAVARLAPKLSALTIEVSVVGTQGEPAPSEGVDVTLNGEPLQPSLVGAPLERDAGQYVVRVAGARVIEVQERTVTLAAGESQRVSLRVSVPTEAAPAVVVAAPLQPMPRDWDPLPPPPAETGGHPARRTAGWIAIGVGSASIIGAGVSLAVRQSANSSLQRVCPQWEAGCDSALQSTLQPTVSEGHLASTLVTVFGTVGIVGLAGGIVLLATAPSHRTSTTGTSVVLSPQGILVRGRFQ